MSDFDDLRERMARLYALALSVQREGQVRLANRLALLAVETYERAAKIKNLPGRKAGIALDPKARPAAESPIWTSTEAGWTASALPKRPRKPRRAERSGRRYWPTPRD
jgi:hypothetical protein